MGPWRWSVQPGGRRWHRGVVVEVCLERGGDPGTGRLRGWPSARAGRPGVTLSEVAMGDPVLRRPAGGDPDPEWPATRDPVRGGHP